VQDASVTAGLLETRLRRRPRGREAENIHGNGRAAQQGARALYGCGIEDVARVVKYLVKETAPKSRRGLVKTQTR
jgi:hypothetical protein